MMQPYSAPPVVEAVIEIRFNQKLDANTLVKVAQRLEHKFLLKEDEIQVQVEFSVNGPRLATLPFGFKSTSLDQTDILQMRPNSIAVSRRAPYLGWDYLESGFIEAWTALKKVADVLTPTRIGVRFINRIDVPGDIIDPGDYVSLFPDTPQGFPSPTISQAAHVTTLSKDKEFEYIINVAIVPSPLLNHGSIQLDIDLAKSANIPSRTEGIRSILVEMRKLKNEMFETLITKRAREVFSK